MSEYRHIVSRDVITGNPRILFACPLCGFVHPNYPVDGKCRRCKQENTPIGG